MLPCLGTMGKKCELVWDAAYSLLQDQLECGVHAQEQVSAVDQA